MCVHLEAVVLSIDDAGLELTREYLLVRAARGKHEEPPNRDAAKTHIHQY
jgi:hypothetical protein